MCGAAKLQVVAASHTVNADDGAVLSYQDTLTSCSACGDRHYTYEQALASGRARAGALRRHAGLLAPDDIRAFREREGLTQAQLEALLGTGAKTVVRWERGTVCQSRSADQLLRLLIGNPSNLALLASSTPSNGTQ